MGNIPSRINNLLYSKRCMCGGILEYINKSIIQCDDINWYMFTYKCTICTNTYNTYDIVEKRL